MSQNCTVFGCANTFKNTRELTPKVYFYCYPGRWFEKEKQQVWIKFARRKNLDGTPWTPTCYSRICSQHFVGNKRSQDPKSPSFNPTIRSPSALPLKSKAEERYVRVQNRRKSIQSQIEVTDYCNDAVPQVILETKTIASQTDIILNHAFGSMQMFTCSTMKGEASTYVRHKIFRIKPQCTDPGKKVDAAVGNSFKSCSFNGFHSIIDSEDGLRSLTGVQSNVFSLLISLLPKDLSRNSSLQVEDKLLVFLMKIKLGISFSAISTILGVHRSTVSRIFFQILLILKEKTADWIFWPSKETVCSTMPECFRNAYPNCRAIIDCTEVKTSKPTTIEQQVLLYSQYKSAWTIKFLIAITPAGLISFVSKAYGGRATDSFITNDSGFLNKLEPKDVVLADKGFPQINAECDNKNIILVMPPFCNQNEPQFSEESMKETYKIASVRIHVERAIQRVKIFNILQTKITTELIPYMDDIIHFCCALANLQPTILKQ